MGQRNMLQSLKVDQFGALLTCLVCSANAPPGPLITAADLAYAVAAGPKPSETSWTSWPPRVAWAKSKGEI